MIMKRLIYTLFILLTLCYSCDSFLDVRPTGEIVNNELLYGYTPMATGRTPCRHFYVPFILESVKKLEKLFIAPKARQILHETAHRALARCECA